MSDRVEPTADAGPQVGVPDTTDMIDLAADDPIPDEITDPDDPSWVEPASLEED